MEEYSCVRFSHRKKECEKDSESKNKLNEKNRVKERDEPGNLDDNFEKSEVIINVLLNNLKELESKQKPSSIRGDKGFTLDSRKTSMESAFADDNGAYLS